MTRTAGSWATTSRQGPSVSVAAARTRNSGASSLVTISSSSCARRADPTGRGRRCTRAPAAPATERGAAVVSWVGSSQHSLVSRLRDSMTIHSPDASRAASLRTTRRPPAARAGRCRRGSPGRARAPAMAAWRGRARRRGIGCRRRPRRPCSRSPAPGRAGRAPVARSRKRKRVLLGAGQVDRPRQDAVTRSRFGQAELGVGGTLLRRNGLEVDKDLDRAVGVPGSAGQAGQVGAGPELGQVCVPSTDEADRHVSVGEKAAHLGGQFVAQRTQLMDPRLVVGALGAQRPENIGAITGQPAEVILSVSGTPPHCPGVYLGLRHRWHGRTLALGTTQGGTR